MMGRPRLYEERRIATAVRLPASLHEELKKAASCRDVSVNFLVSRAVADYLQRLPSAEGRVPEMLTSTISETGSTKGT